MVVPFFRYDWPARHNRVGRAKLLYSIIFLSIATSVFGASDDSYMRFTPLTLEIPTGGDGGYTIIKNVPSSGMWYSVNDNGDN